MRWNLVGAFKRNFPFGTEIAFAKGLREAGEWVTTVDPSYPNQQFDSLADVTVVFKWLDDGPYKDALAHLDGVKIIYQVDDLRFPHIQKMMSEMLSLCPYALTFDESGAILARKLGYRHAQKLLLTADPDIYHPINCAKPIDVIFVGSLTNGPNHESRRHMVEIVKKLNKKFVVMSEIFDISKVCRLYNQSKIILNHATDVGQGFGHGYGYQCRHFEAGMTKSFVLSNRIDTRFELDYVDTFGSPSELEDKIIRHLNDGRQIKEWAEKLHEEIHAYHLPIHRAREMISFAKQIWSNP